MRCALLCVACDIPAGKKVCGFLSHVANLGCSKCYCTFSTSVFGKNCYAGFDRDSWLARTNEKHRRDISEIRKPLTKLRGNEKKVSMGVDTLVYYSFLTLTLLGCLSWILCTIYI